MLTAAQLTHPANWQQIQEGTVSSRRPHRGLNMLEQILFVHQRLLGPKLSYLKCLAYKRHQNHQLISQLILYVTEHISWWLACQHFIRIELCRAALGNPLFHTRGMMGIYYQDDFNGKLAQKWLHVNFPRSWRELTDRNKEPLSDQTAIPIFRLLRSSGFATLWEPGIREEGWIKNGVVTA